MVNIIDLSILFGSLPCKIIKIHVVNASSSYNAVIRQTTVSTLKVVTSIPHLKIKFPTEFEVGEIMGDQAIARQCYLTTVLPRNKCQKTSIVNQVIEMDPGNLLEVQKEPNCVPMEETEEVTVDVDNPARIVKVGKKWEKSQ